ncbi:phytanoyl-CoA dioxygenase family protein [Sulfitobacter aestuariivivens]|uniref:Phytanoyl-CoA dioxygenase family protein n=1 Tax=Sulfitobacter aestuariivivens TaxID=2766981 RepID=A0A927D3R2_9RHOB|nr:phytanoyl-CoA dioxygenase family protein [Sulfitobacter aestuariivivens]MBD3662807.1 phytanoyl-CoA dioxygenase family protein [Sulfitobacter aestuariivivens]
MRDTQPLPDGHLTADQQAAYWDDGFLFPLQVMPPQDAASLRAELEEIEQTWLDNGLLLPLSTYKRVNAQYVLPLAYKIGADPRILDVVEGILGPDILIYAVEFFIKEPRTTHKVTMHQDLTYWGLGAIDGLVTAWLALSPATPASGCMDFVRSSHKNAILPHADSDDPDNLLSRGQEVQVDVAEGDKVPIELHPGQISLHHGLTIHGSGANTTNDRRIGAVIRYCTPEIAQQVADKDYAMLVRGADRVGNFINVAAPTQPFTPASLAIYDEVRTAQSQAMMAGAKVNSKGMYV